MKIILFALITLSLNSYAQEAREEAIILNQELQFLEESATRISQTITASQNRAQRTRDLQVEDLENKYFGEQSDDVTIRSAAPKTST